MNNSMDDRDKRIEGKFDEIMPWIGFYITAASAACTAAMAADAINGFRRKKYWFPCKYFTLNGLSLTLLAIAMKLTQDVNTNLYRNRGILPAKASSFAIMSTCMANFMPSLGSMNDKELVTNMVALGIMVITILANVLIEVIQLHKITRYISISLLLLLPALVASAISIPTIKRDLESKYQEKHKIALMADEMEVRRREALKIDRWRQEMVKYWVMAETSNPQFVLARSVVCTTLAFPLVSVIFYLIVFIMMMASNMRFLFGFTSVYGVFTRWILLIQITGATVGIIAPTSRWFVAVGFKCMMTNPYNLRKELRIESHWIQALVDWRDTFSSMQIRQHKWRRYLHDAKWFLLTFCIGIQILIIIFNKLLVLILVLFVRSTFLCTERTKKLVMWLVSKIRTSNNHTGNDYSNYDNLKSYVLLLDGEAELPAWILKGICRRADNTIRTGQKKQSMSLLNLLRRFDNFNGVGQFDTIQQISAQDIQNCWTLPVVTLASIAIALPNISKHERERLLNSVSEGLSLAKIVDKASDNNAHLLNVIKAANISWVGVALYSKWLDVDLSKISLKCRNSEEVLQELYKKAERTLVEYKRENYSHWSVKVVVSNSMYRICETILSSFDVESQQTDEGLFDRLSVMIADILAACLTNLAHIITAMCHHNAIEKREERVHEAFLLFGKTEHILDLLQKHEWPCIDHDKAAYIDEWRAFFCQNKDYP